jgi:hypothetical protein
LLPFGPKPSVFSSAVEKLKKLTVILYEYKTWSLALREEHRLRVYENMVLRRMFGPKCDEVRGECRKLHNEHRDLYFLPCIIRIMKPRRMGLVGHVARMGKEELV